MIKGKCVRDIDILDIQRNNLSINIKGTDY